MKHFGFDPIENEFVDFDDASNGSRNWFLPSFYRVFTEFLPSFTEFYRVFTGFDAS